MQGRKTAAASVFIFMALALRAHGGELTKSDAVQPGAEGAVAITASEYDSIQAAIDALPEGGGFIVIPPGRYEITVPLRLSRGDVTLRGAGPASHIVNRNEEGAVGIEIAPPDGVKSLWRVQISDLRVTGNPKSGAGIMAKSVDELLISRVASEHNGTDGIVLDHCYEDARVSDSLMNYNKYIGLNLIGCHDIVVSANQFEENLDALHCIDGFNLTMTGNNVDDHLGNGIVVQNTYGSIVSGNMIEECNGHAVVLRGACYGFGLNANTFAHCQGEGVRLEEVRDITVSANTFVLLAEPAVHVLNGAAMVTITGNTFSRYPFDPTKRHKVDPGQGILLEGTRDITVCGNSFTNTRREAIRVTGEGNTRLNITGNTVLNASVGEPGAHAALDLASVTGSIIANNLVTDDQETKTMKQALAFQGACGDNIVTGNIITGGTAELSVPGEGNLVAQNIAR